MPNKLYRRDNIGIFDLNYENPNNDGMVIGLNQKAVYINMYKWIEHLEVLMLAKPYRESAIIKSAYLGF